MSRIGKRPIDIPGGVKITPQEDGVVTVTGPKGSLQRRLSTEISLRTEGSRLLVERPSDAKQHRALHGLTRTLVANMVEGVTRGYEKQLEIQGVGFRASVAGDTLQISVGYSHQIEVAPRPGITFAVANDPQSRNPVITISGIDKERVGQTAADIRKLRKPEPYKGKGIRYKGEQVRRKAGKSGAKGKGGKK
ncbi:MAG TPA: 50S ribosomal protein L6 [Chthonomonadales bacterium]|nr:50S ribosomal protein L6 [Chthonomonadales bacterium]